MNRTSVATALAEAGLAPVARRSGFSAGSTAAERVELADGTTWIVKSGAGHTASLLVEEGTGLEALAETDTVLVARPAVLSDVAETTILVIPYFESRPVDDAAWSDFGRRLAQLHLTPITGRPTSPPDPSLPYGFPHHNHCGASVQLNSWHENWIAFHRDCRLRPHLEGSRVFDRDELALFDRLCDRLDALLPDQPRPSLLHGDLWSGNALPTDESGHPTVALIDPACSYGDGWADIAMMRMFGGFPPAAYRAYEETRAAEAPFDGGDIETRLDLYQLYHVLNHVTLFGRSYAGQAIAIARRYA